MTQVGASPDTAASIDVDVDVVVIGAGFSGLYSLYKMRAGRSDGPGVRAGRRRGRDLVLEPLSGSTCGRPVGRVHVHQVP